MKKLTYFVMALAMVLGFTQCKKEQPLEPENEVKTVGITLNVGGNSGSRHSIDTDNGDVDFQNGDVIYVGNGSTYIGTLTHNGTYFSGTINEPANGTEIYFYFVGGLTPSVTPSAGSTSSFTVDISDQSTQMPVLSSNHVTYDGSTSYSCVLQNQCALVKFTTPSTEDLVYVGGLYTEALIDFDNNCINNNGTTGFVTLNSESATEKWAVLLPQAEYEDAEVKITYNYRSYKVDIPGIAADDFITGESAINITDEGNVIYLDYLTESYIVENGETLTGTLDAVHNETQRRKISIREDATITLRDAHIIGIMSESNYTWAGLNCLGNATIILEDGTTNEVQGFHYTYPGIYIPANYKLTINANGNGTGTLDARCSSTYQGGAGIGAIANISNNSISCGNIEINGGVITATGAPGNDGASKAPGGAGIGGAYEESCGTITINGGRVTANGGLYCAGIGTGSCSTSNRSSTCGAVTINGGTVIASGGQYGAGIGAGHSKSPGIICECESVTITGGTVTATGRDNAAGIGTGYAVGNRNTSKSICGDISITGGTVTAIGGAGAAGIGTGIKSTAIAVNQCGTIGISTAKVTAKKGSGATNSIGKGGSNTTCGNVTIGGSTSSGVNPNQDDGLTYIYEP